MWIWQQNHWPRFRWREKAIFGALESARAAHGRILGITDFLGSELGTEAAFSILIEEGLKTSAIEGEKLPLDQLRSSVAKQLDLPHAGLPKPARAIDGLVEVLLDATQHYDDALTSKRLFGWHAALFPTGYSGITPIRAGSFRGKAPMRVVSRSGLRERVHFEAPPSKVLRSELKQFLEWFARHEPLDGLVRAGIAHLWFVTLHPFEDGNGRLARAITDMAIAQDDKRRMRAFSLSNQIETERDEYYAILEKTQRGDVDITDWLVWFLSQVKKASLRAESTLAPTLSKAKFWLRFRNTDINPRQTKLLNQMLDVDDFEGGINVRKYMGLTRVSRATAYRELIDLVQKGCLTPLAGGGRSSAYRLSN